MFVNSDYSPIYLPQYTGSYTNSTGFTDSKPCGMDAVPPNATLASTVSASYADTVAAQKVDAFDLKCCPASPDKPCQEEIYWRNVFKGCPVSYSDDITKCEVAPLNDRYWLADLDAILYERSIAQDVIPDEYKNFGSRQALVQFLYVDKIREPVKDPYTRRLTGGNLKDAYCAKLQVHGPPKYTNF